MANPRYLLTTSKRVAAPGARKVSAGNPNELFQVTVVLKPNVPIDRAAIYSASLQPKAARRFLEPAAHGKNLGPSAESIQAVESFAKEFGLHVVHVPQGGERGIKIVGSRDAMRKAFGVNLNDYELPGGERYRGRVGYIHPPSTLEPYVVAVLGLDNRPIYHPHWRRSRATVGSTGYPPQTVAALYDFPKGDGAGQTVAIIELGGAFDQGELDEYFNSDIEQPRAAGATVTAVYVDGVAPVPYNDPPYDTQGYTGDDVEVMLDIEVVGAIAPAANIVVYFADNHGDQHFYNAVSQAVHANPRPCAVSISWGGPESGTLQALQAWDDLAVSAAALGTAIFVASGDDGASDEDPKEPDYFDGQRHVDAPADTPHVVACGGTQLNSSDGVTVQSEVTWNEGETGGAGGGGVSTIFTPAPAWQTGCSAEGGQPLTGRGVPDVAGDADTDTGYMVRSDGQVQPIGGTSAVAPLYAGLFARIAPSLNGQIPFLLPLFYKYATQCFNDITQGNNSLHGVQGYSAQAGWDACTGLGSPKGSAILSIVTNPPG